MVFTLFEFVTVPAIVASLFNLAHDVFHSISDLDLIVKLD